MAEKRFVAPLTWSECKVLQEKIAEVKVRRDKYFKDCENHDLNEEVSFFTSLYLALNVTEEYYNMNDRLFSRHDCGSVADVEAP